MFGKTLLRMSASIALLVGGLSIVGCSKSQESASRDTLTENVGKYEPAPASANKPSIGVPPFAVQAGSGFGGGGADLNTLAADQMTTLLDQTGRFHVIERTQLDKLLAEQNLEGIVKPGELAKAGQVRGVNYLLIGKVTNLRVKREKKGNSFGLGQVGGGLINLGGASVSNKSTVITSECGVDIRLVDPTTGEMMTTNFSEFKRTDSADSMGVTILGANADANADIELSEDDKGKLLRLALDDAVRKCLPKIDNWLRNQPPKTADAPQGITPVAPVVTPAQPTNPPAVSADTAPPATVAGKKFCPECGTANAADAKFCAKCGHKLD
jgi:curli biogenesis system outer membrane secretion channel CsgG